MKRRTFLVSSLATSALLLVGCGSSTDLAPIPPVGDPLELSTQIELDGLLAHDLDGNVYRINFLGDTVSCLGPNGEAIWVAGSENSGNAIFNYPVSLEADNQGFLYVADRGNGEVDVLDQNGNLVLTIGPESLSAANDLALDRAGGELFVCDGPSHNVKVFSFQGALLRTIGDFGTDGEELNFPSGIDFDSNLRQIHIVDHGNGRVLVFSNEGQFVRSYGELQFPRSIVVLPDGSSLVAETVDGTITRFDPTGAAVEVFVPTLPDGKPIQPRYISLSPDNTLIINGNLAFQA